MPVQPRENTTVELQEEDLRLFKRHYSKLMYQAILTCTQKSLQVGWVHHTILTP